MWFRLEGPSQAIREAFPAELGPVYLAASEIGDVTFLLLLLTVLYLVGVRREAAAVVGYGFGGYAAVILLKEILALPRPPQSWWLYAFEGYTAGAGPADLYGVPSGHAVAAVAIYGGLAVELGWRDRRKLAAVAGLIGAIALSRVALGVHYLGDVLLGLVLGAVLVAAVRRLARGDPRLTFVAVTPLAVLAVAVTGFGTTALGVLGACLGGLAAGRFPEVAPEPRSRAETGAVLAAGLGFVLLLQAVEPAVAGLLLAAALVDLVLVAGVFGTPLVVAQLLDAAPVEARREA